MSGAKITRFFGILPKISTELLPETAGQVARNTKLFSGDLIPYSEPVVAGNTGRTEQVSRTLYALKDPDTGENRWLSWEGEVDTAVVTFSQSTDQRFYYTGDGKPKVTNYTLAFTTPAPNPGLFYELGLPIPEDRLEVTVDPFVTLSTVSFSRDSNNTARLVTSTPHRLRTGLTITVSGFSFVSGTYTRSGTVVTCTINNHGLTGSPTVAVDFVGGDAISGVYLATVTGPNTFTINLPDAPSSNGDVRLLLDTFNVTGQQVTVVDDTTIEYFSPGPPITTTPFTDGRIDLGGLVTSRSYVFTWITPWDEESIASKPSTDVFVREGTRITVSNIPKLKPVGDNFVRGIRLYRTLANPAGTEYFRLQTIWFPVSIIRVERTAGVSTVRFDDPHNLGVGDRFKIENCTIASFNVTDAIVLDIPDENTITFEQALGDQPPVLGPGGSLFHDISQNQLDDPPRYLDDTGPTFSFVDDFDPLALLDILTTDEYDQPPPDLKGLIAHNSNVLAGFVGNKVFFSEPGRPHAWPNAYSRTMEFEVVALVPISGSTLVLTTGFPYIISGQDPAAGLSVQKIEAMYPCLSRRGVVSMNYGIVYPTHDGLAVFSPGSGPDLITRAIFNKDTWKTKIDPTTIVAEFHKDAYVAAHSGGAFAFEPDRQIGGQFVDLDTQFTAAWYDSVEGKLFYTVGDQGEVFEWDPLVGNKLEQQWKSKTIITPNMVNMGAARVIADFADDPEPVTFRFWVDKQLIFEDSITDSGVFRLPTGYRSDTFEVEVLAKVRIRAIHLAINPLALKRV